MLVTQKKQYALRAVFELARHGHAGPLKTAQIAEAQGIPVRFLEIIMNHLGRAGMVSSKRGIHGGYALATSPAEITVADIFKALEGDEESVACISCLSQCNCPFFGECAFIPLWSEVQSAIDTIYARTTIQVLLDQAQRRQRAAKASGRAAES